MHDLNVVAKTFMGSNAHQALYMISELILYIDNFSQLHLDHNVPIQSTKPKVIVAMYVDDPIIPYDIGELQ
jgi:hypothetical protein